MNNSKLNILSILLFSFCLLGISCENEQEAINELEKTLETAVETANDIEMFYSEQGNVRVKIKAPLLLRHKTDEPFVEFPDGVIVIFYDKKLKESTRLTADYAMRLDRKNEILIRDNVVVINERNDRIETEEMIWNEKDEKITGNKFVKIITKRDTMYGENGFEANQDFTHYKINKFSGTKQVESKGF